MNVSYDFAGRVAIVTGAARGVGRDLVAQLISAGAHVVAADRDESVAWSNDLFRTAANGAQNQTVCRTSGERDASRAVVAAGEEDCRVERPVR